MEQKVIDIIRTYQIIYDACLVKIDKLIQEEKDKIVEREFNKLNKKDDKTI